MKLQPRMLFEPNQRTEKISGMTGNLIKAIRRSR